jgi:hypothetical protein
VNRGVQHSDFEHTKECNFLASSDVLSVQLSAQRMLPGECCADISTLASPYDFGHDSFAMADTDTRHEDFHMAGRWAARGKRGRRLTRGII